MRFICLMLSSLLAFYAPDGATQPSNIQSKNIQAAIRQIDTATDPGAVIDAYSAGVAINPNDIELLDAYVQKMIHLELPNQAASAAEKLLTLQPNNASARIVVADAEARRGQLVEAITDVGIAGPKLSDDKFAVQTAAKLFAWYDNADPKPTLPASIQPALDKIRHDWQDLVTYRLAYGEATTAYKREAASTQSSGENNIAPPITYENEDYSQSYMPSYTSSYSNGPAVYQPNYEPYYPYAPAYYEPTYSYPYPYYPYYWGAGFVFVNHDHHDHHHDGDHHGDHHDGHHGGYYGGNHNGIHSAYQPGDPRFMGPVHPQNGGRSGGRQPGATVLHGQGGRPAPAAQPAARPAGRPAASPAKAAPAARPAPAAAKSGSTSSGSGGRASGGGRSGGGGSVGGGGGRR